MTCLIDSLGPNYGFNRNGKKIPVLNPSTARKQLINTCKATGTVTHKRNICTPYLQNCEFDEYGARNYRPSFRENKPSTLVFYD
jgi:hypothetical protein